MCYSTPCRAQGPRAILEDAAPAPRASLIRASIFRPTPRLTACVSHQAKAYNNCIFFNVQRDFIAQTGDPTNTGTGGESAYQCVRPNLRISSMTRR